MADMSIGNGSETPARRHRAGQIWWTLAVIAWAAVFVLAYEMASRHERHPSSPQAVAVGTRMTAAAPQVTGGSAPRILGLTRLPTPPPLMSAVTSPAVGSAPAGAAPTTTSATAPSPVTSSPGASSLTGR